MDGIEITIRAFWRRIHPFRNDYDKDLPEELPVCFRASMETALSHSESPQSQLTTTTQRIAELTELITHVHNCCTGEFTMDVADDTEAMTQIAKHIAAIMPIEAIGKEER